MSAHDWRPTCGTRKRVTRAAVGVREGLLFTEYLAPRAGTWSKHPVPCRALAAPQAEGLFSGAPS